MAPTFSKRALALGGGGFTGYLFEIGALTAFLCGEAAASITGTALPVDGGWTAR